MALIGPRVVWQAALGQLEDALQDIDSTQGSSKPAPAPAAPARSPVQGVQVGVVRLAWTPCPVTFLHTHTHTYTHTHKCKDGAPSFNCP